MQADNFKLRIELGNAGMFDEADVADALRRLADRLEQRGEESGGIMDYNGNTVGSFQFSREEVTA